jgi:hypothetical protein
MSTPHRLLAIVLACACGPVVATSGDDGTTTAHGSTDPSTTISGTSEPSTTIPGTTESPTGATTIDSSDTNADSSTSTSNAEGCTTCCDICPPDGGADGVDCSLWDQDCSRGTKCMPWANDGGKRWNATRCSTAGEQQLGEPCIVEGSSVSGVDNCAEGLMCFWADAVTGEGTCVALCGGNEAKPVCEDPSTMCAVDFEGVIILCLPTCDPLLQDCERGGCFPVGPSNYTPNGFACGTPLPPIAADGEPCEVDWDCMPGSMCPSDEQAPACDDGPCCTPLCALDDPLACGEGFVCTQVLPDDPLPDFDLVGYCALPR